MTDSRFVFDDYADRYDAWYDTAEGKALFTSEVLCLQPPLSRFLRPYLEVGAGTGRFAEALGIEFGIDPSARALEKARQRGVKASVGVGEALPYEASSFGGVLAAFTLCFVQDAAKALAEMRRVLKPGGGLVLGILLKGSPWADDYARRGAEGHPLYQTAHFYTKAEIEALVNQAKLRITGYSSTLFQKPGQKRYNIEEPVEGYSPNAGFTAIAVVKLEEGSK